MEAQSRDVLSRLKRQQQIRRQRVRTAVGEEQHRFARAQKMVNQTVLKYARSRQRNYDALLVDVKGALADAEMAADSLDRENAELRDVISDLEATEARSHAAMVEKMQDHLNVVQAQLRSELEHVPIVGKAA